MKKKYLCNKCKKYKTKDNFFKNGRKFKNPRNNRDGLATICKECIYKASNKNREKNREKYNEYSRNWSLKNKEKRSNIRKKYCKSPKGIYNTLKKRSNLIISQKDFLEWYNKQKKICYYCGIDEKIAKKSSHPLNVRLNIDRKDNERGYEIDNICLSCGWCNRIKTNLLTEDEMKYIGKKFIYKKYKRFNN